MQRMQRNKYPRSNKAHLNEMGPTPIEELSEDNAQMLIA